MNKNYDTLNIDFKSLESSILREIGVSLYAQSGARAKKTPPSSVQLLLAHRPVLHGIEARFRGFNGILSPGGIITAFVLAIIATIIFMSFVG